MAQESPRERASMNRSHNGTTRAASLETERKHCVSETEKGETIAARWTPERKQSEPVTDVASDEATDKQLEDTCRRGACRRLEREGQRRHLYNGHRSGEKEKAKTFETVSPGQRQGTILERVSVSKSRDRDKIQNASGSIPQLCGRGKTGARRGRRGRRGNREISQHELEPRPTCERRRSPISEASLQPQFGKLGGQKLARSWRALKGWRQRAPTRSRRPLPRMIWSGVCWEMVRNKNTLMAIHVLMMIAT